MTTVKKKYETPVYKSSYQDTINDLVGKVNSGQKFEYNPMTDAAYQSYAQQYKRLGNQARENTLADVATNTGGLASSYAVTAAQQAQNIYNQALTDKIPELQELAYSRHMDERNYNLNALGAMQGLEQADYQKYRDNVADIQWQKEFDYQSERDKIADQQWQKEYSLNKQAQEFSQKMQKDEFQYNKMLNSWTLLGYATAEVAKYFGVKKGTKTSDQAYRDAQLAAAAKSSGGGSGGSGGNSGKIDTTQDNSDAKGLSKKAQTVQANLANHFLSGGTNEGAVRIIKNSNLSDTDKEALLKKFNLY